MAYILNQSCCYRGWWLHPCLLLVCRSQQKGEEESTRVIAQVVKDLGVVWVPDFSTTPGLRMLKQHETLYLFNLYRSESLGITGQNCHQRISMGSRHSMGFSSQRVAFKGRCSIRVWCRIVEVAGMVFSAFPFRSLMWFKLNGLIISGQAPIILPYGSPGLVLLVFIVCQHRSQHDLWSVVPIYCRRSDLK